MSQYTLEELIARWKHEELTVEQMAARRRKTLVVCRECHVNITHGQPTRQRPTE